MDGTLHMIDGKPVLRFERRLSHPIDKVWRALTDPAEIVGWFPWVVEMDARVGGRMSFTHPKGLATAPDAVITEWEPPHVFAYVWNDEPLRWELTEDGAGCVLVFTNGLPDRPRAAKIAAGWHMSLDALAAVLAGDEMRLTPWAELNSGYLAAFGLLDGHLGDDRLLFEHELVYPAQVVWEAVAEGVRLGEVPPETCRIGDAGAVTELAPTERIAYSVATGAVTISVVPQQFGVRLVVTQTGPAESLAAARPLWHDKLVALDDELAKRPVGG